MTALTGNKFDVGQKLQTDVYPLPVAASAHIYNGAMVCKNASGYSVPAADTASFVFQGVAIEEVDNTTGSNGDLDVKVYRTGVFKFTFGGSATQADVGKQVYVTDDQTVDLAATTTNDVAVGEIVEFVDANTVYVDISRRLLS